MNRLNSMLSKGKQIVAYIADRQGMAAGGRMQQILRGMPGSDEPQTASPKLARSNPLRALLEKMVAASGPNSIANLERAMNRLDESSRW
jgi:hypothetical protein